MILMEMILFKIKLSDNTFYEYMLKEVNNKFTIFYSIDEFKICELLGENSRLFSIFSHTYNYKYIEISDQEYKMLKSKNITIIKMTVLKIINDNYGNINS